jgi:hypothetical protein
MRYEHKLLLDICKYNNSKTELDLQELRELDWAEIL